MGKVSFVLSSYRVDVTDLFLSLRRRSPFCIAVILLVALRQREATGPPSELSRCIQEQVERMGASDGQPQWSPPLDEALTRILQPRSPCFPL